ncbi:ATP-dependent RNA helicase HrpA [Corynebacterium sp. UMB10321]|uniref:ATP-dependent RNA helicase HrpA n=1 Tax=Corynebacterium sp. UMB10321 TaxID=3046312 RepID=UPI00254C93FE|nr:ATP-dependent RNA helicase HrpA [Corynebacterium sp. UMB10321]MDK8243783.1 ATP-dependent RNA helicase HrpA [Corynebacterium sp. UMB10321]
MKDQEQTPKKELFRQLDNVELRDVRRLRRRIRQAKNGKELNKVEEAIARSLHVVRARDELIPNIEYPDALPVSQRKNDILEAVANHQVTVIAGETGSGKTTQIPKMLLELGRGRRGRIAHTQPRRLAARTVAERIADELGQSIGESVGYAIRFDDKVSTTTSVKLMTDGILLTEIQRDRFLNAYDTIIIDEAHERSLNIDFLLGYVKELLPKRPDLKVIITSATIDVERFAQHFCDEEGNPAPIIEVSGRTYPVEVRYRPLVENAGDREIDIDMIDGVINAIKELMAEGDGDILCFFASERDIRDCMEAIEKQHWKNVEVAPLFGRLSNAEQHRVFSPHSGRRIVLSTNIAETSLTVPGIHYVVDTGLARISRYSTRTKVQRLPIEEISQASANQRSGRCGRVADGIAIRLYSEENFNSRPEFTDPEILRTNLASVILQMISLNLGDMRHFPFVESPDDKAIRDGLTLLYELGAIKAIPKGELPKLTKTGHTLAKIPVDPKMARMLVEAERYRVLEDVTAVVAHMSIQDVRERPLEFQAQADQAHARFKDKTSDFLSALKLWDYVGGLREELSGNQFRKRMKREYLHYMRIREWHDLVRQLRDVERRLGWDVDKAMTMTTKRDADSIHRALLTGLLSNIGARDGNSKEYQGARGTRFLIFPGSSLAKTPPEFLMASELVETSRLWARDVAKVESSWIEHAAGSLLKHVYSEPFWSRKRACAMVHQKSLLYGIPIVRDRLIPYHRVDPTAAREMFIRHALIDGDWTRTHKFLEHNSLLLSEAAEVEEKLRRRGIVVDEDTLFDFYDVKLPDSVTTANNFDSWWKKQQQLDPGYLHFDPSKLVDDSAQTISAEDFPMSWSQGSMRFDVSYKFEPGTAYDGVTIAIPLPLLASVESVGFDWLVPGLRKELLTELIRSLPKPLRKGVVPAPDFADRALERMTFDPRTSVTEALAQALTELGASGISGHDFRTHLLPPHLLITFAVIDKRGKIVDSDKSLLALKKRRATQIRSSVAKASRHSETAEVPVWTEDTLGDIPESTTTTIDGNKVEAYPALEVTPKGVRVAVHPTRASADASMMTATLTLLLRAIEVSDTQMTKGLPLQQRVAVDRYPHGGASGLVEDARVAAIRDAMIQAGGPVRSPADFDALCAKIKPTIPGTVRRSIVSIAPGLAAYSDLMQELKNWSGPAIDDIREQLAFMLPANAITVHGMQHLQHLPRYIEAIQIRLEHLEAEPERDEERQAEVANAKAYLERRLEQLPAQRRKTRAYKDVMWRIQELRVSLFAQHLGTQKPVSVRRIEKMVDKLR